MPNITATLTSSSADMLAKLCGMLGSDYPAERAEAGRKADALVRGAGLRWSDVIAVPQQKHREADWHAMRTFCAERPDALRPREQEFVDDLADWRGVLTEKQQAWLISIYHRLRG